MQNAALLGQNEYGTPGNNFSLFDPAKGSYAVAKNYAKHFSGAKVCQNAQAAGCTQYNYTLKRATNYQNGDGSYGYVGFGSNPIIILNNGAVMGIQMVPNCQQEIVDYERDENGDLKLDENGNAISSIQIQNFCADIRFDVNGPKNPNQFGRDAYSIMVGKDKLYPNSTGHLGAASLLNILTGKDELIYENTKVGN